MGRCEFQYEAHISSVINNMCVFIVNFQKKKVVTRQQLQTTPITPPPHSSIQHSLNKPLPYHPTQYSGRDPVNPFSVTGIPIRSPPKPTIKRDFHRGGSQSGRGHTVLPVATDNSAYGIPKRSYNHSTMYHYTHTVRTRSVRC